MNKQLELELTQEQIDRQDFVDNAIARMLSEISGKTSIYGWHDINDIGAIRDVAEKLIVHDWRLLTEQEFYPFIEA